MPPIRNSCVARGTLPATGFNTVYTVPASTHLILKFAGCDNNGGSTASVLVLMHPAEGGNNFILVTLSIPTVAGANWSGWTALNAGDSIVLYTTSTSIDYWLAGALLPQIPGF